MYRRLAAVAAAVLLPLGLIAAPVGPAAAAPDTGAAAGTTGSATAASAGVLAALQRDLGLTADQARDRLVREDRASRTEARLRAALGSTFAGAWLTADATFVVAVTDARRSAQVRATGAQVRVVARNAATLDRIKAALDRTAGRAPAAS
ncbi:MAG TPA: S1 family peptidase, partial [Micromonosporaceae bacterium]